MMSNNPNVLEVDASAIDDDVIAPGGTAFGFRDNAIVFQRWRRA